MLLATVVWIVILGNPVVLVWLWVDGGNLHPHTTGDLLTSIGRLTGLLGAYLALIQVVLLARLRVLEQLVGFDRLTIWHRWNGHVCIDLIIAHVIFTVWGYALLDKIPLSSEISTMLGGGIYPGMITATVGTGMLLAVVATSLVIVRRRLRYEWWYAVHLLAYGGIALSWFHEIPTGNELVLDRVAADYWRALYLVTLAILVIWRLLVPLVAALQLPAARCRRHARGRRCRLAAHHGPQPRAPAGAAGPVLPLALPRAPLVGNRAPVLALRGAGWPVAAHHGQGPRRSHLAHRGDRARHARARRGAVRRVHEHATARRQGRAHRRRDRHHADPRAPRVDGWRRGRDLPGRARGGRDLP